MKKGTRDTLDVFAALVLWAVLANCVSLTIADARLREIIVFYSMFLAGAFLIGLGRALEGAVVFKRGGPDRGR